MIGIDIFEGMMNVGCEKVKVVGLDSCIFFVKEDCIVFIFFDKCFDVIIVVFGVCNFEDFDKGFCEMYCVLKDNGKLVILEFFEFDWFFMK